MSILLTNAYRDALAAAIAAGSSAPQPTEISVGIGTTAADPTDTGLESPVVAVPLDSVTVAGNTITVTGTITYVDVGVDAITEVGILAPAGLLIGRGTFAAKVLAPGGSIVFTLYFQT